MFCQSSRIIMGVSFIFNQWQLDDGSFLRYHWLSLDGQSSSVSWLLISSRDSSLPCCEHIFPTPPSVIYFFASLDNHICCSLVLPVLVPCTHRNWVSRASGTLAVFKFTCLGEGWQSRFWGVSLTARLLTSTVFFFPAPAHVSGERHCFLPALQRA